VSPSSTARRFTEDVVRTPLHEKLLGTSKSITEVSELIHRLAGSDLTVLITGESGTGKDIAARLLHKLSPRFGKPFIKVNCPAIPESILESELFGYERGAFTGARTSKPGRFELADRGTIFLDEIAETPCHVQGKLLQVLDGEPFMRIGGTRPINADVRAIAATNMSLEEAVRDGRMREDIYFRLSEVIVHIPPLRERPEDIPLLLDYYIEKYASKFSHKNINKPSPETLGRLISYSWPGNVREIQNIIKRCLIVGKWEEVIDEFFTNKKPTDITIKGKFSPKSRQLKLANRCLQQG